MTLTKFALSKNNSQKYYEKLERCNQMDKF